MLNVLRAGVVLQQDFNGGFAFDVECKKRVRIAIKVNDVDEIPVSIGNARY